MITNGFRAGLLLTAASITGAMSPAGAQEIVDEIVVTGEKVDRSLQDTITSVGLVTGAQLELDAVDSLADSFAYIANVNLNQTDEGFSIRGIPFDTLLGAGSSPLAQIYVDDVTIGDQATRFSTDNIWDVAQIEVLRGAQSTVQGRNALAGAIIIRTQDPTFEWEGKARAIYLDSDYGDEYSTSLAFGGPLIDDVLAFRVSGERRESDGFSSNPVTGEENGNDFNDQWQGRVKLLFTPTERIRSLLTFAYTEAKVASARSDRQARDENGFTIPGEIVPGSESNRQEFVNFPDFNKSIQYNTSLKTDWDVTDALTLTSITAYSDSEINEQLDTDGSNLDPALFANIGPYDIPNPFGIPTIPESQPGFIAAGTQFEEQLLFTQEFIASYDAGGRFRGLGGLYYVNSQEEEFNFTPGVQPSILATVEGLASAGVVGAVNGLLAGSGLPQAAIDLAADTTNASVLANYSDIGAFIAITSEPLDIENYAVYASGEYDVSDSLTVGFGLRYDYEEQTEGLTVSGAPLGIPNPASPTVIAYPSGVVPPQFEPAINDVIFGVTQATLVDVNAGFEATLAEARTSAEQNFEALLPSGFIRYDIDEDRSLSFSIRRGYRAGGSDLNIPRQFVSQFDPEYTLNYEVALRSFWFDRALRVNANVFYTDWTDQQVVVALSTLQQDEVGFNVGSSIVYGGEIDATWQVTDAFSIQTVFGVTETEFEDFDAALAQAVTDSQTRTAGQPVSQADLDEVANAVAAFENQEFGFAPTYSGATRFAYQGADGLFGVLGLTYEGESNVNNTQSSSPTFLNNEERFLVNFTAGYTLPQGVTIAFIARNLLDEEYVASGGDEFVRLGDPRQIGLRVQANF